MKKILHERQKIQKIILWIALLLTASLFLLPTSSLKIVGAVIVLALLSSFYLSLWISAIDALYFVKWIPIAKLTEGDWLVEDVRANGRLLCSTRQPCLDETHITLMKREGIKKAKIKVGIPFVPAIFLATAGTVVLYFAA